MKELAAAYAEYSRTLSPDLFWAFESATMLAIEERWDELWDMTLLAIDSTPYEDAETLAIIAAGPLEDVIRYAAPQFEERIAQRIPADAKFRRALTGAWARQERAAFWQRIAPLLSKFPTDPLD